jgi:hypothetical protein
MKIQQRCTKPLSLILAAMLCFGPELMSAQQSSQTPTSAAPANPQSNGQSGTTVDPTKAPLQPVTTYPDAPTPQQEQNQNVQPPAPTTTTTTTAPAPQTQKPVTEPVGAAAAEKVPTAGGAASKPAGAAIAPAKQRQTRSLFIKIGAIAAGGLAAGTIYALSHGTSPKPPGATGPGVTQK